jgi:hypothetical protein
MNRVILIASSFGDEAKPRARSHSVAFVSQVVLGEVLRILPARWARKIAGECAKRGKGEKGKGKRGKGKRGRGEEGKRGVSSDVDIQHPIPDTQHPIPDTQHPSPDTQHATPDTRHPIPDTQHPSPDTQHATPDTRHPTPDT